VKTRRLLRFAILLAQDAWCSLVRGDGVLADAWRATAMPIVDVTARVTITNADDEDAS
jgi:hypothetical protein